VLAALGLGAAALWLLGSSLVAPHRAQLASAIDGLPSESVGFPSASGSELRGWFVPGRPGGGAVLLLHGIRSNRAQMIPRARFLHDAGYAVLLFDFQAEGESTGEHITFGYLESKDAAAARAWLAARLPGEPIGAIGVSLGGAAAVLATPPLELRALVSRPSTRTSKPPRRTASRFASVPRRSRRSRASVRCAVPSC
jgi:dienelactone hydrolase